MRSQERLRGATREISHQLRNVIAIKDAIKLQHLETRPHEGDLSDDEAARHLNRVMQELDIRGKVGACVSRAGVQYVDARSTVGADSSRRTLDDAITAYLIVEVLIHSFSPAPRMIEPLTPRFEFLRMGPNFPSPLFKTDRFAYLDDRKLYGVRLRHFGAFLNPEWRKSDFIWGRLDAAHHLLRLFINGADERDAKEAELHRLILAAEVGNESGDAAVKVGRQRMGSNLAELSGPDSRLVRKLFDTPDGKALLQLVISRLLELASISAERPRSENLNSFGCFLLDFVKRMRPLIVRDDSALASDECRSLARRITKPIRVAVWDAFDRDPRMIPESAIAAVKRSAPRLAFGILLAGFLLRWRRRGR